MDFRYEDDFDAVLGINDADMFENDKDILDEKVFVIPKVNQSESSTSPCSECAKICILKGVTTRYIKKKGPESFCEKNKDVKVANGILSSEKLKIFIEKSVIKLTVDQCHSSFICNKFLKFETFDNILEVYNLVEPLLVS